MMLMPDTVFCLCLDVQESANSDVHYLQLDLADLASVNCFSEALHPHVFS